MCPAGASAVAAETTRGTPPIRTYSGIIVPWLWAFGLVGITVGVFLNESYNPTVLGRYSLGWSCVIIASCSALVLVLAVAIRRTLAPPTPVMPMAPERVVIRLSIALAAAAWGASLLTQYPVDPYHVRRLFLGEVFGATQRPGVLLEYAAQFALGLALILFVLKHAHRAAKARRAAFAGLLLVLASLVATYLLGEGVVRGVHVIWLQPQGEPTKLTRMWNVAFGTRNAFGYRDREFEPRRDPAEFRILVIGDSFTFGTGVSDRADRFTEVLARDLAASGRFPAVRVFNAGVPGADSVDELRHLRDLVWLRPDMVILGYVFNDIEHVNPLPLGDTPFGAPTFSSRLRPHRLLMLNSHLLDELLLRYRRATLFTPETARPDHYFETYADPVMLARHLDVVVEIADTAARAGAEFRLVPLQDSFRRQGVRMHDRVFDAMRDRGIAIWRHEGLLASRHPNELRVNTWDGHPNARAHHRIGHFLAEQVLATARRPAEKTPSAVSSGKPPS